MHVIIICNYADNYHILGVALLLASTPLRSLNSASLPELLETLRAYSRLGCYSPLALQYNLYNIIYNSIIQIIYKYVAI